MNLDQLLLMLETQGIKLLGGLVVLGIGLFVVRWILRFIDTAKWMSRIEPTLQGFLKSLLRILLYAVVIVTAVGVMGVPLTSFVTLLATAGAAISLAMQGALSNFVGGIIILLLKPIKAGEYVKIGDMEGTVKDIGVFYTDLLTPDNRHIALPNSSLTNTAIVNNSREGTRRMDVEFAVSYTSDVQRVYGALTEMLTNIEGILSEPAPEVHLSTLGDSALTFTVRVWCQGGDYWKVHYALLEQGKAALDGAGIEIPYPQMDIHIKGGNP